MTHDLIPHVDKRARRVKKLPTIIEAKCLVSPRVKDVVSDVKQFMQATFYSLQMLPLFVIQKIRDELCKDNSNIRVVCIVVNRN